MWTDNTKVFVHTTMQGGGGGTMLWCTKIVPILKPGLLGYYNVQPVCTHRLEADMTKCKKFNVSDANAL